VTTIPKQSLKAYRSLMDTRFKYKDVIFMRR